jgi:integrase
MTPRLRFAAEGLPLNIIQAQLGHSNAATTSRYLDHIAPRQVVEAMRKREWRV